MRACCLTITTDRVAYKQPKFISHSSEDWEVQPGSRPRRRPAVWFIDGVFTLCPQVAEGVRESSRVSLIRVLIPVHEGSTLMT